ncbi:MAG: hypothetical protein PHP45_06535 [Elusimicrobiales bacterium]|nr:hypothetical protein [Elusimicrobiales bacterium]
MHKTDKVRLLVFTTVFGALWGIVEMLAGTWLHMMKFPFTSTLMAAAGGVILCVERSYTPVRGAALYTGLTAVCFKLLSPGASSIGSAIGIAIEAAMAEAVLTLLGVNSLSFFVTVLLVSLEGIPHFFVSGWLLYGRGIFDAYLKVAKQMQGFFGVNPDFWKQIAALWVGGHLLIGALFGLIAVRAGKYLRKI